MLAKRLVEDIDGAGAGLAGGELADHARIRLSTFVHIALFLSYFLVHTLCGDRPPNVFFILMEISRFFSKILYRLLTHVLVDLQGRFEDGR